MRFYFEHFRSICIFSSLFSFSFFIICHKLFLLNKMSWRASVWGQAHERINRQTNERNKLPHLYSAKQTLLCIILTLRVCWSWILFDGCFFFLLFRCYCIFTPVFFSFLIGIVVSISIWFNKLSLSRCVFMWAFARALLFTLELYTYIITMVSVFVWNPIFPFSLLLFFSMRRRTFVLFYSVAK